ncbi:MAG: ECF transporter S component [Prevotellaceae bacterium]|jgi:thiamine transporter ThiT|nr:ECF transporter S component [Prevotellaceae bacterium]
MESTAKLYSLSLRETKTYLFATLFIAGNIILPQVAHLVPGGGLAWLPIYFFTLIAAYKYGIRVGLLTAVLSPLVNSVLFGMPVPAMLPAILVKSSLLALAASYFAYKAQKVSLLAILAAIVSYQVIGTAIEWAIVGGTFNAVITDFTFGFPGLLVQLFAGYFVLRAISKL